MAGSRRQQQALSLEEQWERLMAAGELGLNAATGAGGYALGAGAGLGRLLADPDNPDVARNYGRQVADRFTYEPRGELAQAAQEQIGAAMSPLLEPVGRGLQYIDDRAREQGYGDQLDTASVLMEGLGAVVPLPARARAAGSSLVPELEILHH